MLHKKDAWGFSVMPHMGIATSTSRKVQAQPVSRSSLRKLALCSRSLAGSGKNDAPSVRSVAASNKRECTRRPEKPTGITKPFGICSRIPHTKERPPLAKRAVGLWSHDCVLQRGDHH